MSYGGTAPRKCGLCKRSPRENDSMPHPVRVTAEDLAAAAGKLDAGATGAEPGLYQMCVDCKAVIVPIVDKRLIAAGTAKDEAAITDHLRM